MMNRVLSQIIFAFGIFALSFASAKKPTELDKAVTATYKENRTLQKAYYGKLVTQKKAAKAASKKIVVEDLPVELGSDIPDLDYVPTSGLNNDH